MHYLLFYEVADDYLSRRDQFREAHLEKAWKAAERSELVLAGALANPVDGAVLLFQGDSPNVAERFAQADPYVANGLVKRWYVREWTTVAGRDAATPVRLNMAVENKAVSESASAGAILRLWKGQSSLEKEGGYIQHATQRVFPTLSRIEGYRGAYLLRRAVSGAIEFVVLTLWESMAAVRRFAGSTPDKAVIEPEAKPHLTSFDDSVTHFEVVYGSEEARKQS